MRGDETLKDYDDSDLIKLYEQREEEALQKTAQKYGNYCYEIAYQILKRKEDCEEVLNDTYFATWNSIPPNKPASLKYYLGKICRNLSINRYHAYHRQKRLTIVKRDLALNMSWL